MNYKSAGSYDLDPASGGSGVVASIVPGANVTVDNTDPANPIVAVTGGGGGSLESVVAGQNIQVDDTDPANPVVSLGSEESVVIFAGDVVIGAIPGAIALVSESPLQIPGTSDLGSWNPVDKPGTIFYDQTAHVFVYSNGEEWVSGGGAGPEDSGLVLLASRAIGANSGCTLYGRRIGGQVTLYLTSTTGGSPMAWNATRWFVPGVDAYLLGEPENPGWEGWTIYTGWTESPGTDMAPTSPGVVQLNNGGQLSVTPEVGGPNVTGSLSVTITYTTTDPFPEPVDE